MHRSQNLPESDICASLNESSKQSDALASSPLRRYSPTADILFSLCSMIGTIREPSHANKGGFTWDDSSILEVAFSSAAKMEVRVILRK